MDFDYDKIRKICTNILSNAFKFTPNKGSISLDIAVRGTNLELTFTDTGCGIEDEARRKYSKDSISRAKTSRTTEAAALDCTLFPNT